VGKADDVGLRPVITEAKLKQIWNILRADPNELPSDHNKRYDRLKTKLYSGDILKVAEVLRDLAWRREEKRRLTMRGKRLYNKGMEFLSAEVAGAQDSNVEEAESKISEMLFMSMSTSTAA
jgi:CarD family transcriptional regulator